MRGETPAVDMCTYPAGPFPCFLVYRRHAQWYRLLVLLMPSRQSYLPSLNSFPCDSSSPPPDR